MPCALLEDAVAMADLELVGLVVKGLQQGLHRGYAYLPNPDDAVLQSDRAKETITVAGLRLSADAGSELTFTLVPFGTQVRIGIDRDEDGYYDRDELDACSDPADAGSIPGLVEPTGDADGNGSVDLNDFRLFVTCLGGPGASPELACRCAFDWDMDNDVDMSDFHEFQKVFEGP